MTLASMNQIEKHSRRYEDGASEGEIPASVVEDLYRWTYLKVWILWHAASRNALINQDTRCILS